MINFSRLLLTLTFEQSVNRLNWIHMNNACYKLFTLIFAFSLLVSVAACKPNSNDPKVQNNNQNPTAELHPFALSVVAAFNFGGSEYKGSDGVLYSADTLDINAAIAYSTESSMEIKGSQDAALFKTYRLATETNKLTFQLPVDNGQYAVSFMFAEPDSIKIGERTFDINVEGETVIADLDILLARDNNMLSSLVRTVTAIKVTDGILNVELAAVTGQPLIHAIVIRKLLNDPRNWQLMWNDEFAIDGLPDPTKWQHDIWSAGKVNSEDQAYTDRAKNARIEDGVLVIEAHKEQFNEAEYTSARLHNSGSGDFLYGKVEARARIPHGQGTWSAIWMLPLNPYKYATSCKPNEDWQGSRTCDAWPNSGEIDILEHVGYDMQVVHGTVHTKAYYWVNGEQRKASVEGRNVDKEFHLYSMEWSPEHIIISFDNVPYFYYQNEGSGWEAWPFDHPYNLILNLAIGGNWGRAGGPIDDSIFPLKMEVDYVRIYQLAE
ncbi:MAG: beta-glucanase (GH16 family) [Glaciecola sp.]|jgi:beta-glucanase (GH16 family)